MKKNRIRLTESQLHKVIKESVKKVLREAYGEFTGDGFDTHRDWWEGLSDEEIEDKDKELQNADSWDKIDRAYKYHQIANRERNLYNDTLMTTPNNGELAMAALGKYGDQGRKFSKSFKGNVTKDTPLRDMGRRTFKDDAYLGVPDNID